MLMRTDPFRDFDRLAQQVLGTPARPAAMPIDAYREGDEFVAKTLLTGTVRGHEHHYAVGQGNVTHELMEFAAWKKIRLIEKVPYADYVQIEGVNV